MAKYWISQWHPFIWRLSWTKGPSHTLIQNSRKLSKKQITYSMNMTQEGATNSCNKQFIKKSIWKLFLDFTGMEIVRSQTGPARSWQHCLFPLAIKWTSSYSWTQSYNCEGSKASSTTQPHSLSPANSNEPKSRLSKPVCTCISCCPGKQHSFSPESSRETT